LKVDVLHRLTGFFAMPGTRRLIRVRSPPLFNKGPHRLGMPSRQDLQILASREPHQPHRVAGYLARLLGIGTK